MLATGYVASLYSLQQCEAFAASVFNGTGLPVTECTSALQGVALTQQCFVVLLAAWPLTYFAQVREWWVPRVMLNVKSAIKMKGHAVLQI